MNLSLSQTFRCFCYCIKSSLPFFHYFQTPLLILRCFCYYIKKIIPSIPSLSPVFRRAILRCFCYSKSNKKNHLFYFFLISKCFSCYFSHLRTDICGHDAALSLFTRVNNHSPPWKPSSRGSRAPSLYNTLRKQQTSCRADLH